MFLTSSIRHGSSNFNSYRLTVINEATNFYVLFLTNKNFDHQETYNKLVETFVVVPCCSSTMKNDLRMKFLAKFKFIQRIKMLMMIASLLGKLDSPYFRYCRHHFTLLFIIHTNENKLNWLQ